jgi:hypothetical protein
LDFRALALVLFSTVTTMPRAQTQASWLREGECPS